LRIGRTLLPLCAARPPTALDVAATPEAPGLGAELSATVMA
jgi:hypothetical protein